MSDHITFSKVLSHNYYDTKNSTIHHCGFSDYVGLGIVAVMTIVVCRNLSKSSVIFHFNVNFPSPNLTKVICLLNASAAMVAKVASQLTS